MKRVLAVSIILAMLSVFVGGALPAMAELAPQNNSQIITTNLVFTTGFPEYAPIPDDYGYGWSWSQAERILTLDGLDLQIDDVSAAMMGIELPADSTIVLIGHNRVIKNIIQTIGIGGVGDLTIIGPGSLEIEAGFSGIFIQDGNVDIQNSEITFTQGINTGMAGPGFGIHAFNISITDSVVMIMMNEFDMGMVAHGVEIIGSDVTVVSNFFGIAVWGGSFTLDVIDSTVDVTGAIFAIINAVNSLVIADGEIIAQPMIRVEVELSRELARAEVLIIAVYDGDERFLGVTFEAELVWSVDSGGFVYVAYFPAAMFEGGSFTARGFVWECLRSMRPVDIDIIVRY